MTLHKKSLGIFLAILFVFFGVALAGYFQGYRINNGQSIKITDMTDKGDYGDGIHIKNSSNSKDFFIPTKSTKEWDALKNHTPSELAINSVRNGEWSTKSYTYGTCNVSCGTGTKPRYYSRSCTNPTPAYGGTGCSGPTSGSEGTVSCNTGISCHCRPALLEANYYDDFDGNSNVSWNIKGNVTTVTNKHACGSHSMRVGRKNSYFYFNTSGTGTIYVDFWDSGVTGNNNPLYTASDYEINTEHVEVNYNSHVVHDPTFESGLWLTGANDDAVYVGVDEDISSGRYTSIFWPEGSNETHTTGNNRSSGWHKLKIELTGSQARMYIDNMSTPLNTYSFSGLYRIAMGSKWTNDDQRFYYDNFYFDKD